MGKYSCDACKKKCKKEAIKAMDKYYHPSCFTCAECKKQLSMNDFYTRNNQHYCSHDYERLFSVKCDGCGQLAEGEVMTVLGKSFHHHCFKCSLCGKQFEVGEKVTFSKNKSLCQKCSSSTGTNNIEHGDNLKINNIDNKEKVETEEKTNKDNIELIKDASSPSKQLKTSTPERNNNKVISETNANGDMIRDISNISTLPSSTSPVSNRDSEVEKLANGSLFSNNQFKPKSSSSLPRVFGMPDSRFYNISYLERANNNIRRGVAMTPVPSQQPSHLLKEATLPSNFSASYPHYHVPENFSYMKCRRDFLPETKEKRAMKKTKHESLRPIERDDWPGPPDPAAAYPELLRAKKYGINGDNDDDDDDEDERDEEKEEEEEEEENKKEKQQEESLEEEEKESENEKNQQEKIVKKTTKQVKSKHPNVESTYKQTQIKQLSRMSKDSGTAAEILKEFQKRMPKGGTIPLDPRNASRTPSASHEPKHKPRYKTPYYASPSRYLDSSPMRSKSTDTSLRTQQIHNQNKTDIVRPYTSFAFTSRQKTPFSFDHNYQEQTNSSGDEDERIDGLRPHSATNQSLHGRLSSLRIGEFDPETGLRNRTLKSCTLPAGFSGITHFSLLRSQGQQEPTKYDYENLKQMKDKILPGVNKNALESHLTEESFQKVFHMTPKNFSTLPIWQRNELKIKAGLA